MDREFEVKALISSETTPPLHSYPGSNRNQSFGAGFRVKRLALIDIIIE